jgi:uncharacterized protein
MTYGEQLLALQALDRELDQLLRHIDAPAELGEYEQARQAVALTEAELTQVATSRERAEAELAEVEATTSDLDRQVQRLQQQLRSVVVVREAEALQHELATLAQRRSDLDDRGLVALDELESLDTRQLNAEGTLPAQQQRLADATIALEEVRARLRERHGEQSILREQAAQQLAPGVLSRYEALRKRLGGVGAAALEGSRCGGCRLDLARTELEEVRSATPDELVECPNCGRLLVR